MKNTFTLRSGAWILLLFAGLAVVFTSCEKIAGHTISTSKTPVTKQGNASFTLDGNMHILSTTSLDTVSFNTTTVPVTTITAKNGQKNLAMILSFNANTAGSFPIASVSFTVPTSKGTLTTSATNSGTVTVDSFNVYGGLLTGSFTTSVKDTSNTVVTVTGTFNIQQ
ncbi:hypothetical protein BEL04_04055 [Mucilaginibacter sp. PPCGB 2223]|uniref:hypothetical protein n=1 Tax=Mucilaginibacter sp. PPCGB 2223 TaxID=1886027 RepID=UPI0008248CDA|nr:hypothetical protein [Mucilaginibacter sp. PPCGB 2223]OCX53483.1 hypothetical protein BEL04_04055 [Mucilaginibacter sp. PPCGB 2223]